MFKNNIPNLFTFANLAMGVLSILQIIMENYLQAAIFIMVAGLIDRYDGRIARFLNVSSELGKELDSLADLISFGVAPALLIFMKFHVSDWSLIKVSCVCFLLLYVVCGSYRLAKYNLGKFDGMFIGMPITVAGCILALYSFAVPINNLSALISMILLILLAFFMVSNYRFKKI